MSDNKREIYAKLKLTLDAGGVREANRGLRVLREGKDPESVQLHGLLAARIALKSGKPVDWESLEPDAALGDGLQAETHYVRGLAHFAAGDSADGAASFREAAAGFGAAGKKESQLVALFNEYVGDINGPGPLSHEREVAKLRIIERLAFEVKNRHTEGLVARAKSLHLQSQKRLAAALNEGKKSIRLLEIYGTPQEYDLALLQLADLYLDSNQPELAQISLERVNHPSDPRTAQAFELLSAKLAGRPAKLSADSVLPLWRDKLESWQRCCLRATRKNGRGSLLRVTRASA